MRLQRGFAYLLAVIDWYSWRVLIWRISNSLEAAFFVGYLRWLPIHLKIAQVVKAGPSWAESLRSPETLSGSEP